MEAFAEPVPAGDVIIAPTRGRNMGFWWKFARGSGDHRPYEGSQLDVPAGHPVAVP